MHEGPLNGDYVMCAAFFVVEFLRNLTKNTPQIQTDHISE